MVWMVHELWGLAGMLTKFHSCLIVVSKFHCSTLSDRVADSRESMWITPLCPPKNVSMSTETSPISAGENSFNRQKFNRITLLKAHGQLYYMLPFHEQKDTTISHNFLPSEMKQQMLKNVSELLVCQYCFLQQLMESLFFIQLL